MSTMVALGADHAGFPLKSELLPWMQAQGYQVLDVGAHAVYPDDDYPDYAELVGNTLILGEAGRGVLVCGSGVGACIAANKLPGIRAGICHDTYTAHQGVEHDDMNLLCLGARVVGIELAKELVGAFLNAQFTGEERHRRRVAKTLAIESRAHEQRVS